MCRFFVFFFFKQKTAYEMRISDWSSDVCSSDLNDYKDEDLTNEGLRIFTTLDPRVQETLETHVMDQLPLIEKSRKMKAGALEAAGAVTSADRGDEIGRAHV